MHSNRLKNIDKKITEFNLPPSKVEHTRVIAESTIKLIIKTSINPQILPVIKIHLGTGLEITIYTVLESISFVRRFAPMNKEIPIEVNERQPSPKSSAIFSGTPYVNSVAT